MYIVWRLDVTCILCRERNGLMTCNDCKVYGSFCSHYDNTLHNQNVFHDRLGYDKTLKCYTPLKPTESLNENGEIINNGNT